MITLLAKASGVVKDRQRKSAGCAQRQTATKALYRPLKRQSTAQLVQQSTAMLPEAPLATSRALRATITNVRVETLHRFAMTFMPTSSVAQTSKNQLASKVSRKNVQRSIRRLLTATPIAIAMTHPTRFANWAHACSTRHPVTPQELAHIRKPKVTFQAQWTSVSSWTNQVARQRQHALGTTVS